VSRPREILSPVRRVQRRSTGRTRCRLHLRAALAVDPLSHVSIPKGGWPRVHQDRPDRRHWFDRRASLQRASASEKYVDAPSVLRQPALIAVARHRHRTERAAFAAANEAKVLVRRTALMQRMACAADLDCLYW
jgi:hypothetical protein